MEHTLQSLQRLRGAEEEDREAQEEEAGGSVGRAVVSGGHTATVAAAREPTGARGASEPLAPRAEDAEEEAGGSLAAAAGPLPAPSPVHACGEPGGPRRAVEPPAPRAAPPHTAPPPSDGPPPGGDGLLPPRPATLPFVALTSPGSHAGFVALTPAGEGDPNPKPKLKPNPSQAAQRA